MNKQQKVRQKVTLQAQEYLLTVKEQQSNDLEVRVELNRQREETKNLRLKLSSSKQGYQS